MGLTVANQWPSDITGGEHLEQYSCQELLPVLFAALLTHSLTHHNSLRILHALEAIGFECRRASTELFDVAYACKLGCRMIKREFVFILIRGVPVTPFGHYVENASCTYDKNDFLLSSIASMGSVASLLFPSKKSSRKPAVLRLDL